MGRACSDGRQTDQTRFSGTVTRWGIKMAGDLGNAQWTFGALANQAEQKLMNEAGTEVYFNQPEDDRGDVVLARSCGAASRDAGWAFELAAAYA